MIGRKKKVLLAFFFLVALSSGSTIAVAQNPVLYYEFEPLVIDNAINEDVFFSAYTDGTANSLVLAFANGTERPLVHQGDGLYTISITHQEALFDYANDDVNRNFVGYLDAYAGETRLSRLNVFINVLDQNIPDVRVEDVTPYIRISPHFVNFHFPEVDPRNLSLTEVSLLFYQHFPDEFDFLQIISTPSFTGNRWHGGVQNTVQGLGLSLYDNSSSYGSEGRLKGIIRYPIPTLFDLAAKSFMHEIGHQWINFSTSPKLMNVRPHWPISSLASAVMGYQNTGQGLTFPFTIVPLPNDQYRLDSNSEAIGYYNRMELYLMGLAPASQAGEYIVFANQQQQICLGCILDGPVVNFDVEDWVSSDGERIPAYPNDQFDFRVASILVSKYRVLTHREMSFFNHFAARGEALTVLPSAEGFAKGTAIPFALATQGAGTMSTTISPDLLMPDPPIFKDGFENQ